MTMPKHTLAEETNAVALARGKSLTGDQRDMIHAQLERLRAGEKPTLIKDPTLTQQPLMYVPTASRERWLPEELGVHYPDRAPEPMAMPPLASPSAPVPEWQFRFPLPSTPEKAATPATLLKQSAPHGRAYYDPRKYYENLDSFGHDGLTQEESLWLQAYIHREGDAAAWDLGDGHGHPGGAKGSIGEYVNDLMEDLFNANGVPDARQAEELLRKSGDYYGISGRLRERFEAIATVSAERGYYHRNEGHFDKYTDEFRNLKGYQTDRMSQRDREWNETALLDDVRSYGEEIGRRDASQQNIFNPNTFANGPLDVFLSAMRDHYADVYSAVNVEDEDEDDVYANTLDRFDQELSDMGDDPSEIFEEGYAEGYAEIEEMLEGATQDDIEEMEEAHSGEGLDTVVRKYMDKSSFVADLTKDAEYDAEFVAGSREGESGQEDQHYEERQREIAAAMATMREDDGDKMPHGRYEYDGTSFVRVGDSEPLTAYHGTAVVKGHVIRKFDLKPSNFDSFYRETIGSTPALFASTRSHALRYAAGMTNEISGNKDLQLYELTLTPNEIVDLGNCRYDGAAKEAIEAGADVVLCPDFWEQPETITFNRDVVHIKRAHKLRVSEDMEGRRELKEGEQLAVPPAGPSVASEASKKTAPSEAKGITLKQYLIDNGIWTAPQEVDSRTPPSTPLAKPPPPKSTTVKPQLRYRGAPELDLPDANARLGQRPNRRAKGKKPAVAEPRRMMVRHP